MPQLRSYVGGLQYALERARIKQGYLQMLQQGAGALAQRRSEAKARGERNVTDEKRYQEGVEYQKGRDLATDKYREETLARGQAQEDRLTQESAAEAAYREKMLAMREEELYGGKPEQIGFDFSQGPMGTKPAGAYGPRPMGWKPTQKVLRDEEKGLAADIKQKKADAIAAENQEMKRYKFIADEQDRATKAQDAEDKRAEDLLKMAQERLEELDPDQSKRKWLTPEMRRRIKEDPEFRGGAERLGFDPELIEAIEEFEAYRQDVIGRKRRSFSAPHAGEEGTSDPFAGFGR